MSDDEPLDASELDKVADGTPAEDTTHEQHEDGDVGDDEEENDDEESDEEESDEEEDDEEDDEDEPFRRFGDALDAFDARCAVSRREGTDPAVDHRRGHLGP